MRLKFSYRRNSDISKPASGLLYKVLIVSFVFCVDFRLYFGVPGFRGDTVAGFQIGRPRVW